jgi:hypothetical protein
MGFDRRNRRGRSAWDSATNCGGPLSCADWKIATNDPVKGHPFFFGQGYGVLACETVLTHSMSMRIGVPSIAGT